MVFMVVRNIAVAAKTNNMNFHTLFPLKTRMGIQDNPIIEAAVLEPLVKPANLLMVVPYWYQRREPSTLISPNDRLNWSQGKPIKAFKKTPKSVKYKTILKYFVFLKN